MNSITKIFYTSITSTFLIAVVSASQAHAWPGFAEKVQVGKYESRAIWIPARGSASKPRPSVILIPGSGANGPEEAIPGTMTSDGSDQKIFESLAKPFVEAGMNVLALGKPGVEYFSSFDLSQWFYNVTLYRNLKWSDLLENLDEGVKFVNSQPNVDPSKIFLLGHSQGTQVVSDYATNHSNIAGLILLGYSDTSIKRIVEWQLFERPFDHFIKTDVDLNSDGYISKDEAKVMWSMLETSEWKGDFTSCLWDMTQEEMSIANMKARARSCPPYLAMLSAFEHGPLYSGDIFSRPALHDQVASLAVDVYSFTGSVDLQTPVSDAVALKNACEKTGKTNCRVEIVPGVGHGFSPPKGPRKHPMLDMTIGPPESFFLKMLGRLVERLGSGPAQ